MVTLLPLSLLGALMGAVAAHLSGRVLRGEDLLTRPQCRACGEAIAGEDLVPLYAYARLGGHCRTCDAPIPSLLWQAEIAGALIGAAAGWAVYDPVRALLLALWMWSLLALALADLSRFRMPEQLLGLSAILGLCVVIAGDGSAWPPLSLRLTQAFWGAAIAGGALWLMRYVYQRATGREGIGSGDVALVALLGMVLGVPQLPLVVLLAAGAGLSLAWLRARRRGRRMRRLARIPFGAALALAGTMVAVLPTG